MKKVFVTLAAVGLFFSSSCSKESSEPQIQQPASTGQEITEQEIPVFTAVDPSTPGAIRLSLNADVEPFKVAQGSFSEGQGARGIDVAVGGPDVNKAITYSLTAEADGRVPALMYLYDSKNEVVALNGRVRVTNKGKGVSIGLGVLVDPKVATSGVLKRLAEKKAEGVKLSVLIGRDADGYTFTNQGPKLITYSAGQSTTLPENFVMLKALNIPLAYDTNGDLGVAGGAKVSLGLQGYLIGVRFRNTFPATMYKYRWDAPGQEPYPVGDNGRKVGLATQAKVVPRPPLSVIFRLENLSATYKTKITYNMSLKEFSVGRDLENRGRDVTPRRAGDRDILRKRELTKGLQLSTVFVPNSKRNHEHGKYEEERFLDATGIGQNGEFFVPTGSAPDDKKFSQGEQFVVVYCPNPHDQGSIGYKSNMKLFYDGSPLAQMYGTDTGVHTRSHFYALANVENAYTKATNSRPYDNEFFFVTFTTKVLPYAVLQVVNKKPVWAYDRVARFQAYQAAFTKYKLN